MQERASLHPLDKRGSKHIINVPNLFTSISLFCGFLAVTLIFSGKFVNAAWIIFMAGIFDALDGRIARMSGTSSDFGLQMDSLSDVVTSGLAPSILVYEYYLKDLGGHSALGLMLAFLPLLFGAIRLARFNVMALSEGHKSNFVGLPAPSAAALLASLVVLHDHTNSALLLRLITIMTPLASLAMISHLHYEGFPRFTIKGGYVNRIKLVIFFVALTSMFFSPEITFCTFMLTYFVSGPVHFIVQVVSSSADTNAPTALDESIVLEPPAEEPA